jgi:pimeloyl-ACP methyl ester carboxylesterase
LEYCSTMTTSGPQYGTPRPDVKVTTNRVRSEGDDLYFEVRGHGPALLLIPGAGGDADLYAAVADLLSDEFKVITYDRRANARSTSNSPKNFEISQQSRDAVAVIHAAGEQAAFIFGSSSGAVIALDAAKTQPQAVRAAIVHEPPCARVSPNAAKWQRFFANVYRMAYHFGPSLAGLRFIFGIQVPVRRLVKGHARAAEYARGHSGSGQREPRISPTEANQVLMKLELVPVTNYLPDVQLIRGNEVTTIMAVGKWTHDRKTWLAEVSSILAEQLDCELVTFPGHHGSYTDMPHEWAATLRRVLRRAGRTERTAS